MNRRTFLKLTSAVTFLPTSELFACKKKKSIAECILEMAEDCKFKIKPANLISIVKDTEYYRWNNKNSVHRLLFCKPRQSICYLFNVAEGTWKRES